MFAACRAQWQRENYSLYWVLLEHKMHIKSFYALTVQFVLPDWQGAPTHWYHLSCREESSATQSMFPADALSPHTCSDAAQLATTACLPLKGWFVIIPSPSLTHWHVLQRLLPSIVQNHSTKGYVLCTAGTIVTQPLKLPLLPLAWGRKRHYGTGWTKAENDTSLRGVRVPNLPPWQSGS